jgi:hypothetical protein
MQNKDHDWRVTGASSNVHALCIHWKCARCRVLITVGKDLGGKLPAEPDQRGCREACDDAFCEPPCGREDHPPY